MSDICIFEVLATFIYDKRLLVTVDEVCLKRTFVLLATE